MRALVLLAVLAITLPAHADGGPMWPAFRGGFARTGRVAGSGAITTPEVAWTFDLGGALAERELGLADRGGRVEAIWISSGRVVTGVPGGAPRWTSPNVAALAVYDDADLDGDGDREVIVQADRPTAVIVLDGGDGRVLWTLPVDSDVVDARPYLPAPGELPVLVVNHRFLAIEGYRFDAGFASDPSANRLWRSATLARWQPSLAAGDTDGDGDLDLVKTYDRTVGVLDLRTGVERVRSATLMSEDVYFYASSVADVDGDGADEILVIDQSYFYSEGSSLAVLRESGGALAPLWPAIQFADDVTPGPGNDVFRHQIVAHANSLADLDGAMPLELVYSVWDDTADAWTTIVRNAATGAELASIAGEHLEAIADVDDDPALEVVTRDASGIDFAGRPLPFFSTMRGYDVSAAGAVDRGFRRASARAALTGSRHRSSATNAGPISTWSDADADGRPDVYIYTNYADEFVNENRADNLEAMRGTDGESAAAWPFPPQTDGTLLGSSAGILAAGGFDALAITSDGRLHALDRALIDRAEQRVGNHARAPIVVGLAGESRIVAVDSRSILHAIDGSVRTPDAPRDAFLAFNVSQGGGRGYVETPGVVIAAPGGERLLVRARATEDFQRPALLALDATGRDAFRTALPDRHGWSGFGDWQVFDWDGDGTDDALITVSEPDGRQRLSVRSGADGSDLTSARTADLVGGADHTQGFAAVQLDADAAPELVASVHPRWIAAFDVAAGATAITTPWFFAPTPPAVNGQLMSGELDGDAMPDLLRANGQNALGEVLRLDASGSIDARYDSGTAGVASRDVNNPVAVARAGAAGVLDVAIAGMADDRVGRLELLAGDTLAPRWTVWLGDGALASARDGSETVLFDPVAGDVDGDGLDEIVVGGGDGWLYAVRADGTLAWSLEIGSPVEHVAIADVDRDPAIEIVVSARDGMLRAIDGPGTYDAEIRLPPPDAGPPELDAAIALDGGPGPGRDAGGRTPPPASSCGCRASGRGERSGVALLALTLAALGSRRRKGAR